MGSEPEWLTRAPLQIELVPRTSWGANLRSMLRRKDWDRLRKDQYAQAGNVCEICGGKGKRHPVECHEIWSYNETDFVQKLEGLIALCPGCHRCKHPGQTQAMGLGQMIVPHLCRVNGWSKWEADKALCLAFTQWQRRSTKEWSVNTDWLVENRAELLEIKKGPNE